MLAAIGIASTDELFESIPTSVQLGRSLSLRGSVDEFTLVRHMRDLAAKNVNINSHICFLGAGIYDHFNPSVVGSLASRGEFLTAYTPYQPEMSQGILQAIYEYQTLVCRLTGMDMANASMYDAATALAEAALMSIDITRRNAVAVSTAVHPHYRQVLRTYIHAAGYTLIEVHYADGATDLESLKSVLDKDIACAIVQHPNFFGCVEDIGTFSATCAANGSLSIVSVDPISLGLLAPPGDHGVDIVVGEGQALGTPVSFGGPLLGFFACKLEHQRRFPGRIVGATVDGEGRRGYTMTLRTREQDIRRERATSNICSNEALLALCATIYLCEMGSAGLRDVAELSLQKAHYAMDCITQIPGVQACFGARYFKEFAVRLPDGVDISDVNRALLGHGILGGYDLHTHYPELGNALLLCVTEQRTKADIDAFVDALTTVLGKD